MNFFELLLSQCHIFSFAEAIKTYLNFGLAVVDWNIPAQGVRTAFA
jgi:hypothetical protein